MITYLNPDKLNPGLTEAMDLLESVIRTFHGDGHQIVIHEDWAASGPASPHVKASQHFLGRAADFHVEGIALLDAWLAAERVPAFLGIGFYPHWNHPGLHCDVRDGTEYRARWWRDSSGVYQAVNSSTVHDLISRSLL